MDLLDSLEFDKNKAFVLSLKNILNFKLCRDSKFLKLIFQRVNDQIENQITKAREFYNQKIEEGMSHEEFLDLLSRDSL